jgi:septum site-determining protein MinC
MVQLLPVHAVIRMHLSWLWIFDPLQIRISDSIAVSEDDKSQKNSGRFLRRGKKKKSIATGPEVAYTYEGAIAKSAYDRTFLQNNKFFS